MYNIFQKSMSRKIIYIDYIKLPAPAYGMTCKSVAPIATECSAVLLLTERNI